MKYDVTKRDFSRIPPEMRNVKRWVCWTEDKTPINPSTGRGASSTNPATWATFEAACGYIGKSATYYDRNNKRVTMPTLGVGFVLGGSWAGIDLDGGDSHGAAAVPAHVLGDFANTLGTYCEYSKSGEGYHLIGRYRGEKLLPTSHGCVEVYSEGRYFAITGNLYNDLGHVADITDTLPKLHEKYIAAPMRKTSKPSTTRNITSSGDQAEFLRLNMEDMLAAIPADNRDVWYRVGMALKAEGYSEADFDAWSRKAKNYGGVAKAWRSFRRGDGVNGGYIISQAKANGWRPQHLTGEYAPQRPPEVPRTADRAAEPRTPAPAEKPPERPLEPPQAANEQEAAHAPVAPEQLATDKPTKSKAEDMVAAFMEAVQGRQYEPMPTGLEPLDNLIGGGLVRQTLVMLGAAPGMGKSFFSAQVFETMAQRGHNVLYFNLEMSREQMLARSFSRIARERENSRMTAIDVLQGYKWTNHQRGQMERTASYYAQNIAPHMVYNPGGGIADLDIINGEIVNAAERAKAEGRDAPIVVIDYLHLLRGQPREDTQTVVKRAVDLFKSYAIKYNSIVYCILAFGRASNKRGQVTQDSGRDTSAIEYSADLMLGLNYARVEDATEADDEEIAKMREAEKEKPESVYRLKVLKNRLQGGCGSVDIKFSGKYGLFHEATDTKTGMERVDEDLPPSFTTRASDLLGRK